MTLAHRERPVTGKRTCVPYRHPEDVRANATAVLKTCRSGLLQQRAGTAAVAAAGLPVASPAGRAAVADLLPRRYAGPVGYADLWHRARAGPEGRADLRPRACAGPEGRADLWPRAHAGARRPPVSPDLARGRTRPGRWQASQERRERGPCPRPCKGARGMALQAIATAASSQGSAAQAWEARAREPNQPN